MKLCIYAHTAIRAPYPEYISVNVRDDANVSVTVRSPAVNNGEGSTAEIILTPDVFRQFSRELFSHVYGELESKLSQCAEVDNKPAMSGTSE